MGPLGFHARFSAWFSITISLRRGLRFQGGFGRGVGWIYGEIAFGFVREVDMWNHALEQ